MFVAFNYISIILWKQFKNESLLTYVRRPLTKHPTLLLGYY